MGFVIRLAVTAVALWITTLIVPGIDVAGDTVTTNVLTLLSWR